MTNEQRDRIATAVTELNAAMADVKRTDGEATRVYPNTHFSDPEGYSRVSIEVTTGRETIGPHRDDLD